ncbi:hypothetical protein NH340_JMT01715 [Sarcoptes scabiei]|nr:hypothetical protein NH340_JMT01715 [Sarcoptes scabiei]
MCECVCVEIIQPLRFVMNYFFESNVIRFALNIALMFGDGLTSSLKIGFHAIQWFLRPCSFEIKSFVLISIILSSPSECQNGIISKFSDFILFQIIVLLFEV